MAIYLPTPDPTALYCILEINNHPGFSYAYLTVLTQDDSGKKIEQVLFYHYPAISAYWNFVESIKELVPLHSAQIRDRLITLRRDEICPCGHIHKKEVTHKHEEVNNV